MNLDTIETLENGPAWVTGLSSSEYHGGAGWSSSQIKDLKKSPSYFRSRHLSQSPAPTFANTPAILLGRLVHTLVLEPDSFTKEWAIAPDVNARTKAGKAELEEFKAESVGLEVVTKEIHQRALRIRDAVLRTDASAALLTQGDLTFEGSGYWRCDWTGELLKYRADARNDMAVLDLKTTGQGVDYDSVIRTVMRHDYHLSAAHYLEGEHHCHGVEHRNFVLIFVSTDEPYEVGVYTLADDFIELGRRINRKLLRELRHCLVNDSWPGVNAGQITELELPPYLARQLG